ncbi:MAG: ATP-binding protein [Cyanobacteriota bacterium]
MASLMQMLAGVAHEIQNPAGFIYSNFAWVEAYNTDLFKLLQLYQEQYPSPPPKIQEHIEEIELDFIIEDLTKLLSTMKAGAERICEIVRSLSNFSHRAQAEMVDIHKGIDNTIMILQNRLQAQPERPAIEVIKDYNALPTVECFRGQLYQVFMNLLNNAIDALEESMRIGDLPTPNPQILIRTAVIDSEFITISIIDNGPGMTEEVHGRMFDLFFTTKPVGKGMGIGLSLCYQIIVENHSGELNCISAPGKGTEFMIKIPICQQKS